MDPVSPLPAAACIAFAVATAHVLSRFFGKPLTHDRYPTVDGLRGYLAFFVFLHHSSIWYFYLQIGQWKAPPSKIYTHFGQSAVALFFMITGFLFFSKLIDGRNKKIDWEKLYVSRFLRLVPLYLFAMIAMFLIVMVISNGVLDEPIYKLIKHCIRWFSFTIFGAPDLNGVKDTWVLIAGVTWSLPYEWFFYFSLPLLSLLVGIRAPRAYLVTSLLIVIWWIVRWKPDGYHLASFGGGIATAVLVRSTQFRQFAESKIATLVIVGCLVFTVSIFDTAYSLVPLLLLSVVFALIASGNTLLGMLIHPASRTLGEMAYSIYLLHGLILFSVFHLAIGIDRTATFAPLKYWAVLLLATPFLICCSFATYYFIERPAMGRTTSATKSTKTFCSAILRRLTVRH